VNGYSTQQEVHMLEARGLAYDPDLVIINYALNDPTIEEGGMWIYFAPVTRVETWYRAKILWQGIRNTLLACLGQLPATLPHDDPWDYTTLIHGALFDQVETGMQELARLQQTHPLKVIWLVSPLFDFKKHQPYPWANVHHVLKEKSRQYGFMYVDAQEYYTGYNSKKLSVDPIHPNALGHAIIADEITKKILAENILQ
jgi:lysophospholipase L1-like esterase